MTLIVVNYQRDRFWAFSDSRVSHRPNHRVEKITDHLTKTYLVPYHFTSGNDHNNFLIDLSGKIGFAFAGDITAALAIQAMAGNILSYMHNADGSAASPTFQSISKVFERAAKIIHDETIFNVRAYEGFIFGFCPTHRTPHFSKLRMVTGDDGLKSFSCIEHPLEDGMTYSTGTGADYFKILINDPKNRDLGIEQIFLNALYGTPDPATGGAAQLMVVKPDAAFHQAVLQADKSKEDATIYVSGLSRDELGGIDGFFIGRHMIGLGVEEVHLRKELRALGYDPDAPTTTTAHKNSAAFSAMIKLFSEDKPEQKFSLTVVYGVLAPKPVRGKYYFSKVCGKCFLITPLLLDSTNGRASGCFVGHGKIWANCIHCGARAELCPKEMVGRPWG